MYGFKNHKGYPTKKHIEKIEDVYDVHHIHIWSISGSDAYATMHVKTSIKDTKEIRKQIRKERILG